MGLFDGGQDEEWNKENAKGIEKAVKEAHDAAKSKILQADKLIKAVKSISDLCKHENEGNVEHLRPCKQRANDVIWTVMAAVGEYMAVFSALGAVLAGKHLGGEGADEYMKIMWARTAEVLKANGVESNIEYGSGSPEDGVKVSKLEGFHGWDKKRPHGKLPRGSGDLPSGPRFDPEG